MTLRVVAGSASGALAGATAASLGTTLVASELERFPDGELRPVVDAMRGDDVYVVQSTASPVNEHLIELVLWLDACQRAGAARVTAVVPYFGYARQDRRVRPGQPIGVRVAAQMMATAGADRLVVVDPHTPSFEGMCSIPVEVLTATSVLVGSLRVRDARRSVVVAPDLGAVKLAERFAAALGLPVAVVRKSRTTSTTVYAEELMGDVEGCLAFIVDDMIATAATIEATARLLVARGALPGAVVVATHGLFVDSALDRLDRLGLASLLVSDTVPVPLDRISTLEVRSVAALLGDAIGRLHREEPIDDLGHFE